MSISHFPELTTDTTKFILTCSFQDKDAAKSVPGAKWDAKLRRWTYPATPYSLRDLKMVFPHVIVDPAVLADVEALRLRNEKVEAIKGADDAEVAMPIRAVPFVHQRKAFQMAHTTPHIALLFEQGCGKTLEAIAISGADFLAGRLQRMLILAPKSVVPVWPKEYERFADFPYQVAALRGTSLQKQKQFAAFPPAGDALQVVVINYESAWRIEKQLLAWLGKASGYGVIADESQRIKTPGAEQSKAVHRLGKDAARRMILSGTPVNNSPLEFFSQYKFLDPTVFGTSFTAFRSRYARMGGFQGKVVVGYQNLPELVDKAHSIAYRVSKAEALDLPPELYVTRVVELGREARKMYDAMRKDAFLELETGGQITAQNVLTKIGKLQRMTGGFVSLEEDGLPTGVTYKLHDDKLGVFEELLDEIMDAGKKTVVFVRYLDELHAVEKLLEARKLGYRSIYGDVSQDDRGRFVDEFQDDPAVRVFVAQIRTAGLGLTLTAADTSIFYSTGYSLEDYAQACARIHRTGQTRSVTHYLLVCEDTIDEDIAEALQKKKSMADLVVDNYKTLLGGKKR